MQQHIIHKEKLEIEAVNADALDLQSKITRLVNGEALSQMNALFDSLVREDEWLIIDRLDIRLNNISMDNFDADFCNQLISEIRKQIGQKSRTKHNVPEDPQTTVLMSDEKRTLKALAYFLETGTLPWWGKDSRNILSENKIINAIEKEPAFFAELCTRTINKIPLWKERFKTQYPAAFVLLFAKTIAEMAEATGITDTVSQELRFMLSGLAIWLRNNRTVIPVELQFLSDKNISGKEEIKHGLPESHKETAQKADIKKERLETGIIPEEIILRNLLSYLNLKKEGVDTLSFLRKTGEDKVFRAIRSHALIFTKTLAGLARNDNELITRLDSLFSRQFTGNLLQLVIEILEQADIKYTDSGFVSSQTTGENLLRLVRILKSVDTTQTGLSENDLLSGDTEIPPEKEQDNYERISDKLPIKEHLKDQPQDTEPGQEQRREKKEMNDTGKEIYIDNAGLVLLHPFLNNFFSQFDLLHEEGFKDDLSRTTAVHLLHYLAAKEEQAAEYSLVFEKYICGYPFGKPIERFIKLTREMKDESELLLSECIKHWTILRDTTPDGLREGFINRAGKLIPGEDEDRLIVQSNAIDVLLGHIPWSYSFVKFLWKKQLLRVDWYTN